MSAMERTTTFGMGESSRTIHPKGPRAMRSSSSPDNPTPPLRAGTYFVSLGVRTTGVVAEGTVRAEFDTPLQTGGPTYYFPHLAVGASWQNHDHLYQLLP